MFGSYQLIIITKLILFELLGLTCIKDEPFRRYRRLRSLNDINNSPDVPFITVVTVSANDYSTVINCSTPGRVPNIELDWYFEAHRARNSRHVIVQRGRSSTSHYAAYSPDQIRHYLQIKDLSYNNSGIYMCVDQRTGYSSEIELIVRDSRSCAGCAIRLQMTTLACLMLLSLVLSRRHTSESEVT